MENQIGEFNRLLIEDKENKEFNNNLVSTARIYGLKNTHNFYLSFMTNYHTLMLQNYYYPLIKLDEEDLEYLKKKYLPKLEDEMLQEIDKVIKKYKG